MSRQLGSGRGLVVHRVSAALNGVSSGWQPSPAPCWWQPPAQESKARIQRCREAMEKQEEGKSHG